MIRAATQRSSIFALAVAVGVVLAIGACAHTPSANDQRLAANFTQLGDNFLMAGDPRAALVEYQRALELDPTNAELHNSLGLCYQHGFGKLADAEPHFRKAIELNVEYSEAYNNLGTLYIAQERYVEAVPLFEKAIENILYRTPYFAEGNLGWAYFMLGRHAEAIEHLQRAVNIHPRFCQGHRSLGIVRMETGEPQLAVEAFERFAKHCPKEAEAFWRLGDAHVRRGDLEAAREAFKACIELGVAEGAAASETEAIREECSRSLKRLEN